MTRGRWPFVQFVFILLGLAMIVRPQFLPGAIGFIFCAATFLYIAVLDARVDLENLQARHEALTGPLTGDQKEAVVDTLLEAISRGGSPSQRLNDSLDSMAPFLRRWALTPPTPNWPHPPGWKATTNG